MTWVEPIDLLPIISEKQILTFPKRKRFWFLVSAILALPVILVGIYAFRDITSLSNMYFVITLIGLLGIWAGALMKYQQYKLIKLYVLTGRVSVLKSLIKAKHFLIFYSRLLMVIAFLLFIGAVVELYELWF